MHDIKSVVYLFVVLVVGTVSVCAGSYRDGENLRFVLAIIVWPMALWLTSDDQQYLTNYREEAYVFGSHDNIVATCPMYVQCRQRNLVA